MLSAAILTGGRARRFHGRDKASLPVGGVSILERALGVLRELTPQVLLVGGIQPTYPLPDVRFAPDLIPRTGALGGLYTALTVAPTDRVVVVACDMPFLTVPFLKWIATMQPDTDARVPRDAHGLHPLCACYRREAAEHFRARIEAGSLGVIDALSGVRVQEVSLDKDGGFDPDSRLLYNVNTPGDYEDALAAFSERQLTPPSA